MMRPLRHPRLQLAIPEPCQQNWDLMDSNAQGRFCEACQSTVIDFSALTRREAERLIASSEGRVCGRVVHDRNGETMFRPDPEAGRLSRVATLSLASLAGLALPAAALAQSPCEVRVHVRDGTGAGVPKAEVSTVALESHDAVRGMSDENGTFSTTLPAGEYQVRVAVPGFQMFETKANVTCDDLRPALVSAELKVGTVGGVTSVSSKKEKRRHQRK